MRSGPCKHCKIPTERKIHRICAGCGFPMCPKQIEDGVYIIDLNEKTCSPVCTKWAAMKKEEFDSQKISPVEVE